jgi:hypothetical protein
MSTTSKEPSETIEATRQGQDVAVWRGTISGSIMKERLAAHGHWVFASVVPIDESKPKWFMGQYAKAARP